MKKNFFLDIILFISALTCIFTGLEMDYYFISLNRELRFLLRDIHRYSGYLMAIGIVIHIIWHSGWIKSAVENIFKKSSH